MRLQPDFMLKRTLFRPVVTDDTDELLDFTQLNCTEEYWLINGMICSHANQRKNQRGMEWHIYSVRKVEGGN